MPEAEFPRPTTVKESGDYAGDEKPPTSETGELGDCEPS